MKPVKVALVGCGAIAHVMHLPGLQTMAEQGKVELVAVADTLAERARAAAAQYGAPHHYSALERLLAEVEFDLLVNTTVIPSHFAVSLAALRAGKHVYTQKPMAATVEEASILIDEAAKRNVRLACAPEHRVRPLIGQIKRLIEQGVIGRVNFARVRSSHGGPEKHFIAASPRDSTWFYKPGSNPILDLGVHGLSQITSILGPVRQIAALSGRTLPVRYMIEGGPFSGKRIDVEIDDNSLLLLDFGDARFAFLDATYCMEASLAPRLEIYGSEGTLAVMETHGEEPPDLRLYQSKTKCWTPIEVPPTPPVKDLGVLHLVDALRGGRPHLLTGEHGRHLLEIMTKAPLAAAEGRTLALETTF
jgi:predicted dehydrogenase